MQLYYLMHLANVCVFQRIEKNHIQMQADIIISWLRLQIIFMCFGRFSIFHISAKKIYCLYNNDNKEFTLKNKYIKTLNYGT